MPQTALTTARLRQMTSTTPTAQWDDSCSIEELSTSIARDGAAGATANPVIVLARTLQQFCKATENLAALMLDYMVADPG